MPSAPTVTITFSPPGSYVVGQQVVVSLAFALAGSPADPTDATVIVQLPGGTANTYTYSGATITRDGVGAYHLLITLTVGGVWEFYVAGTGAVIAAASADITAQSPFPVPAAPTTPGTPFGGAVAVVGPSGTYAPVLGTLEGDELKWTWDPTTSIGFSWQKQRGFIKLPLDYSAGTPMAATINAGLVRAAAVRPGATVACGDGKLWCEAPINVPYGLTFLGSETGANAGPFEFGSADHMATQLLIKHTGKAIVPASGGQQKIKNFEINYPDQNAIDAPGYTPTPYDWTIYIGANCHWVELENIRSPNAYKLLYWAANGGKATGIHGYPLNRCVYLGRCADVIRMYDCHFNPTSWATVVGTNIRAYVNANRKNWTIDGAEQFDITDCFAEDGLYGILHTDEDGDNFQGSYGTFKGGSLDSIGNCVYIDTSSGLCGIGLKLFGVALIPSSVGYGVLFADNHVPASTREHPTVASFGSSVHGSNSRAVWMQANSRGVFTAHGDRYFDAVNDVLRLDSASAVLSVDRVTMPTGATRKGGSSVGNIVDTNPISL